MFSIRQKREISDAVQKILRDTNHPELPKGEIQFSLHVDGAEIGSWADIRNNGAVTRPDVNLWNEMLDPTASQETGIVFTDGAPARISKQALEYAKWLGDYAKTQGWKDWQLLDIADRNLVNKLVRAQPGEKRKFFNNPPTQEWLEAHKDDNEPGFIGALSQPSEDTERLDAQRYRFLKWECRNWSKLEPLVRKPAFLWDEAIDAARLRDSTKQ